MAGKNLLVNGKNKITARTNALSKIQTDMANRTTATNVNSTPNLPTPTRPTTINLQKAQQPTQTKLNNLNSATLPNTRGITGNNPAFVNGQLVNQNNSRFIGFQKPKLSTDLAGNIVNQSGNILNTTQQGKSWTVEKNKPVLNIPTQSSQIAGYNAKQEQLYKDSENLIKKFHYAVKNANGQLTANDIRKQFPEWKDNINAALQLQADITPLVQQGQFADMKQVSEYYNELLKQPNLADANKYSEKQKSQERTLNYYKQRADKLLESNNTLSDSGKKYLQDMSQLADFAQYVRENYRLSGNPTDIDILKFAKKNIPEVQAIFDELNTIKLTGMDKAAISGSSKNPFQNIIAAVQETVSDVNKAYQENVTQPLTQMIESGELAKRLENTGLVNSSTANSLASASKIAPTMVGDLLQGADKLGTAYTRISQGQDRNLNEVTKDIIKGGGGALNIGFNSIMAIPTALFHIANETDLGQEITDDTLGLFQEGITNILDGSFAENLGLSKDTYLSKWYNTLDDETKADLTNEITVGVLHKGGKVLKEGKLELEVLGDAISNAFEKGKGGAMFQAWIEKGLAGEDGKLTKGAKGRIIKEGFNEFKDALKTNFRLYDTVLKNRRGDITANMNTLPDNRTFRQKAESQINQAKETVNEGINTVKEGVNNVVDTAKQGVNTVVEGVQNIKPGEIIKNTAETVGKGVKATSDLIDSGKNAVTKGKNAVTNTINKGVNTVKEKVNENIVEPYNKGRGKTNQISTEGINQGLQPQESNLASKTNNEINGANYSQENTKSKTLNKAQLQMLQTNNRMNPKNIDTFKEWYGEDYGQWMYDRGFTKAADGGNLKDMQEYKDNLLASKRATLDKIEGRYQDISLTDMADHLIEKADNVKNRKLLAEVQGLKDTLDSIGLTMKEANRLRELFQQNIKMGFHQDIPADARERAKNEYLAVKDFLDEVGRKNGFDDLDEINREIQKAQHIIKGVESKMNRQSANNEYTLTDYILMAEAFSTPQTAAVFTVKQILKHPKVRNAVLNKLVGGRGNTGNRITPESRKGTNDKVENTAKAKRGEKLKSDLSKGNTKALPNKGGSDNGKHIITGGKTIVTDEQGNSKVKGQISEIDKRPSKPEDTTPPSNPTTPTKPTEPKNKITNKTPKKKSESKPKAVKTEDRSDLKPILGEKLYNKLQRQLDAINESRKGIREPITMDEMLRRDPEYYLNEFNKMANDELVEISDKLSKITDGMEDTHLTEDQQAQLAKAKSKKQREALLDKWREEYFERNKLSDNQIAQIEKVMEEANELVKQHDKIRAFFRDIMNEKTEMALQKGYENKVAEELYNETTGLAEKQNKADIALYDEMNAENDAIVDLFDEMKREEEFEKNLAENETPQDIRDMEEQIDYLDNILQNETLQITEAEAPQNKATTTAKNKITNVKVTKGGDIKPDNSGITGKFKNLTLKDYETMQEVEGLEDEYLEGDAELIRNMEQLRDTMYYFDPTDWDLPEDFEIDYNNGYVKDRAKFVAENQQLLDRIEKGKTTKEDIDEYEDYYNEEKKTRDTDGIIKWQKDLISEMFENSVDEAYPSNEFLDKFYDRYLDFLGDRELRETNEKLNNFGVMFNKYNRWWNQGKDYSPSQREYRAKQDFERAMNENETPQIAEEEIKNKVTAKAPDNKPKDLVTNPNSVETLPSDISPKREAAKSGPKRIAPDRISWQQLTYAEGAKRIMEDIKKMARHIELQREMKKPMASRTDTRPLSEINSEIVQTGREIGNILGKNWLYKSTRTKEFKDLWKAIANANNDPSALAGIGKEFYEKKVKQDLSKGYIYPDEVIEKIPGAKKAADSRARYQKGLDTSFSSKDERIDYSAKDKIGGGMKRQDGKPLTEEQENEIVKGVMDFQKTFGINMKKMAEDMGIVYVHVNGKKVFMSKASGMFRRTYNDDGTVKNASVSVGGVETVRWKDKDTGEWMTESANTIMSHELGHVVDYVVDRNFIVGGDLVDIKYSYKRPQNNHSGYADYLRRDTEVVARAFEQYMAVQKGAGESYFDKPGYWSEKAFNERVKPILEKNIKEKLGDWYIDPESIKYQKVTQNAKNKITAKEKSESPISLREQKEVTDRLMKTGLAKDVIYVDATKDLFNLINGTTTQPRYQSVWHGSPYSFDKFDSSNMGKGEGDQAHGWGHYVAVNKKTGEHYAEMGEGTQFRNKRLSVYNGLEDDIAIQVAERLDQDYTFDQAVQSVKEDLQMDIDEFSEYKGQEQKVKDLKKQMKILDEMKEEDFSEGRKNLYQVEIPDQRQADTPTGSNYWEENDNELSTDEINGIMSELLKKKTKGAERVKNAIDYDLKDGDRISGKTMLFNLRAGLGDKAASKFLESLGYDGIHYFGAVDGEAYVIFSDDALDITNHIQYLKDTNGDIAGATLPDGTVVLVKNNLRADTPYHEFSHLLRSYAKENSPALYNAINKIAEEAPQALKDYVKQTYGDLSEDAYLDEVFAWRQGKHSAVKGTEAWYQRMWNAIKELWNKVKSKFGKKYADLSVFDAWEKMSSEELMDKVDNLLKGEKEIGKGKGSNRYELAKQTRDNQGNPISPQMENYMSKSKARVDEKLDAPLVEVYHTTTGKIIPFTEFNPVGTEGYRFGKDVVNYYTDDKDMSGSYAHQDYKTYEGKANLYTRADVDNFIKEINEGDYYNWANKEKINYEIREVSGSDGLGKDKKYGIYQKRDENKLARDRKIYNELTPIQKEVVDGINKYGGLDYYIDEKYRQGWDKLSFDEKMKIREKEQELERAKEDIYNIIEEKSDRSEFFNQFKVEKNPQGKWTGLSYKDERELIRKIEEDVKYKINGASNWQYEGYVNLENPYIIDAEGRNWNTVRTDSKYLNETKDTWRRMSQADKDRITDVVRNAKAEFEAGKEANEWNWFDYSEENQELGMVMGEIFPEEFLIDLADMERAGDGSIQKMVDAVLNGMTDNDIINVIASGEAPETTNDVVKSILKSNKAGETNYDGIIIKNVVDYGGKSNTKESPHNLYITFKSNQFKSRFNDFPTEDPDIRYQKKNVLANGKNKVTNGVRFQLAEGSVDNIDAHRYEQNILRNKSDLQRYADESNIDYTKRNGGYTIDDSLNELLEINSKKRGATKEREIKQAKREQIKEIIDTIDEGHGGDWHYQRFFDNRYQWMPTIIFWKGDNLIDEVLAGREISFHQLKNKRGFEHVPTGRLPISPVRLRQAGLLQRLQN